jgi:hypothetical protein
VAELVFGTSHGETAGTEVHVDGNHTAPLFATVALRASLSAGTAVVIVEAQVVADARAIGLSFGADAALSVAALSALTGNATGTAVFVRGEGRFTARLRRTIAPTLDTGVGTTSGSTAMAGLYGVRVTRAALTAGPTVIGVGAQVATDPATIALPFGTNTVALYAHFSAAAALPAGPAVAAVASKVSTGAAAVLLSRRTNAATAVAGFAASAELATASAVAIVIAQIPALSITIVEP